MLSANWTMSFLDILAITSNQLCGGWGPHSVRVLVSDADADVGLVPSQKRHDCSIGQRAAMWVKRGGGETPLLPIIRTKNCPKRKGKQLF